MKKILILAVHPDDETLGCGGTLLRHREAGDELHWLIGTEMTEAGGFSSERIARRAEEIEAVASAYGFAGLHRLGIPTMRVDEMGMSELVASVGKVIDAVGPEIVYLPFFQDVHSDHRKLFEAAFSCTKSFRYPSIRKVYMMETLSETEFAPSLHTSAFIPNTFVDITDHIEKKLHIMSLYAGEVQSSPFPRSLENMRALATLRGATAGCRYAESFVLLKEVL